MNLFCVILLCVGTSVSLATPDQRSSATVEDLTSSPVIQQLQERVDMLERQDVKQASEIQCLKAEMSQQASEIQSVKADMSQQASEIQSLKAEMSHQANDIHSMKAEMSQQASDIQALKAEMPQQASEIQAMKAEMSQQASESQSMKVEMSQQATEILSLKADMSLQAGEIQSLKAEMSQQASKIPALEADVSRQRTYVKRIRCKLYTKIMLIQRLLSGAFKPTKGEDLPGSEIVERLSSETTIVPEGKKQTQDIRDTVKRIIPVDNILVAFSAMLTQDIGPYSVSHNIVFNYVETNVGNAYNSSSGDFTAPVPGIYVFSTTLLSDNSTSGPYFPNLRYVVNKQKKSVMYMNAHPMVSRTVVYQLNKGDRVAI